MTKAKQIKIVLLVFSIIFCLVASGSAVIDCGDEDINEDITEDSIPNDDGGGDSSGGSTTTGDHTYDESWKIEYDPNNPAEIESEGDATLRVNGGWPQFTWTISGDDTDDFYFKNNSGQEVDTVTKSSRSVTIYARDTDCTPKSATITVTDATGSENAVSGTVYIHTDGYWDEISSEGDFIGQYGVRIGETTKIEEWWCTSCSAEDCTEMTASIYPQNGEIACLENCGDFSCEGVIRTARYFNTDAQATAAANALIAGIYNRHSWSWFWCFLDDNTTWSTYDSGSIPCYPDSGPDKDCIPHLYLIDQNADVCKNKLDGDLNPIPVNEIHAAF